MKKSARYFLCRYHRFQGGRYKSLAIVRTVQGAEVVLSVVGGLVERLGGLLKGTVEVTKKKEEEEYATTF